MAPMLLDEQSPTNVVARRAGLVLEVQALDGVTCALPGTAVTEGQLLISGIEDIETPAYYIGRDKDNKKRLRAICKFNNGYDEEEYDETEYDAFTSSDDANNYLLDTSYEYFKKKVDGWKNRLAKVETSLANALARKADLERILKEEEANS